MSESFFPGLSLPPPVPKASAAVVPIRRTPTGWECFWVERGRATRSFAGFRAFPGGKVDAADGALTIPGHTGEAAAHRICALRELLEETGVLALPTSVPLEMAGLERHRRALLDDGASFAAVLAELGLAADGARLLPAGRWVTPESMPVRFDTPFFLVELAPHEQPVVWPGELASGEWIAPEEGLRRWGEGSVLLHPPAHAVLETLRDMPGANAEAIAAVLQTIPGPGGAVGGERIAFQRGIRIVALRTPTLPPATHTNCYLLGNGEFVVVDPGSPDEEEQARLLERVRRLEQGGMKALAILLTHHHGDHTGGVEALRQATGLPLWAHADTASRIPGVARLLVDGELLELAGEPPMRFRVLHTPGHARGHVALVDEASRACIAGDLVSTVSTIVIDPPEGHLGTYLAQLARLQEEKVGVLYPSHGTPAVEGRAKLAEFIAHRNGRLEALHAALDEVQPRSVQALVEATYTDVNPMVWPLAERSARASLELLVEQGRASAQGEGFIRLRGAV